jgi:hypothetical protein
VTRCNEIPIVSIRGSKTTSVWHWRRADSNCEAVCACAIAGLGNYCSFFLEKFVAIMYAFPLQQFGSNDSYVVCIILSRLRLVLEFEIMFPNRARSDHAFGHKEDCNDCSHLKSIVPVRKTRMMSGNVSMFKCSPASASYRGSGVDISDALPLRFQHSLTRCRTRAGSDS